MKLRFPFARANGFTLIEVIITLCVFILLAAAVFGIFTATLESVSTLQDGENRSDQVQALGGWLKANLQEIPPSGSLLSYKRDDNPFHVTGVVWGARYDLQALDLQTQANGLYTLRLVTYQLPPDQNPPLSAPQALGQFLAQLSGNDPALAWRPLLRDVKAADWRFRMFNLPDWQDNLGGGQKPAIAEFSFQPAGLSAAIVDDFWIPPTQPPGNGALPASASVSATP